MEWIIFKKWRKLYRSTRPLPEGHQGTPGANSESESMWTNGDRKLNRQAMVGSQPKDTTGKCTAHCRNTSPPISTTTESASQRSNPLLPKTSQVGRQCRRMKWTDEINIFIMWAYYSITKLETDFTADRQNSDYEVLGQWDPHSFENHLNCFEVRNVASGGGGNDNAADKQKCECHHTQLFGYSSKRDV